MIKKFIFSIVSALVLISGLFFPSLTLASNHSGGIALRDISESGCLYEGDEFGDDAISERAGYVLTIQCIPIMISNVIYWLLVFSGVVALFLVIFGGFKFMTSGGDPKAVEGAKKTLTWAIIGLVLVLLSFAMVAFIAMVTGLDCITRFGLLGTCG